MQRRNPLLITILRIIPPILKQLSDRIYLAQARKLHDILLERQRRRIAPASISTSIPALQIVHLDIAFVSCELRWCGGGFSSLRSGRRGRGRHAVAGLDGPRRSEISGSVFVVRVVTSEYGKARASEEKSGHLEGIWIPFSRVFVTDHVVMFALGLRMETFAGGAVPALQPQRQAMAEISCTQAGGPPAQKRRIL